MNKYNTKYRLLAITGFLMAVMGFFSPISAFAEGGAGVTLVQVVPGQAAPKFANPRALESGYVSGSDYLGKGWLLLDFFATDCAPCLKELPFLEGILNRYVTAGASGSSGATKLQGILFDQDADRALCEAFFRGRRSPFIVALDVYNTTYRKYKGPGDTVELPLTVVVAPDGNVAFVASGGSEATMKALEAFITANVK